VPDTGFFRSANRLDAAAVANLGRRRERRKKARHREKPLQEIAMRPYRHGL
jgi:hypothetical protein